ncbi:hypothetical protein EHS13_27575 [Paenibacillus psychroresistens]|uniref:Cellulase n=1 Tax=Paenibacillus psychroresistens TaxID=1778678 RepID=A0A6B8RT48_9BACL|nr:cellulase-like family protein [Paenibacillus psychroresistens]QGQ98378.1 hypothetical protein EHS13_27575 [Paenibacillus psychroresistens]
MSLMPYDMRNGLTPRRLTIAMWDYSWLKGHYPGGSFENYGQAVDELVERNFNTVRIDCYPLTIGLLNSEEEEVTILGEPLANWGVCDVDRKHSIVRELVEFMQACKDRGVYVILSTWNDRCKEHPDLHQHYASDRAAFRVAWGRTLDILGSRGLLEHVLYVDLDQEFPYFSPYADEMNKLAVNGNTSQASGGNLADNMEAAVNQQGGTNKLIWTSEQLVYVDELHKEMLQHFQRKYPYLRFTYSLTSFWKEVRTAGNRSYDVLELHMFMQSALQSERLESRIGFNDIVKDRGDHDYSDYQRRIDDAFRVMRPMFMQEMHNRLSFAMEWSAEIGAPVTTSEAWGPWWHMDHRHLSWSWLRDWCTECNELAGRYGLWGTTPWNYAHPYWENWRDVSWYKEVNGVFLRS